MLYTSYFGKLKLFDLHKTVSISLWTPKWYKGKIYEPLQPSKYLVLEYKNGNISNEEYKEKYLKIIQDLRKITPEQISSDLEYGTVMLCYEKPNDFCHRHVIREWLNENGIKCEEVFK